MIAKYDKPSYSIKISYFIKSIFCLLLFLFSSTLINLCAVLSSSAEETKSGTVWAWGDNYYGQLGDNTSTRRLTPVQTHNLKGIMQISGGGSHTLALKHSGTVWAWGYNGYGQLGDNTTTHRKYPVQVNNLTGVMQVSAGAFHSLALKSDGTVWAWGVNDYGSLGDNTNTNRYQPVQVTNLTGVMQVSAGAYHSLALKSDGTVWAWGDNWYGQLGDNTNTNRYQPVQVNNLTGVIQVSAGVFHSLALKSDGTVWAWGANWYGQLGNNTTTHRNYPVQVTNLTGVIQVSGGEAHSLALKSDGTVWAWGNNIAGQLGDNTNINRSEPVQVHNLTNVIQISSGGYHSLALKSDGTVWGWGNNYYGQLGDNTNINKYAPVQVPNLTGSMQITTLRDSSLVIKRVLHNPPEIVNVNFGAKSGDININYDLYDTENDNCSIEIEIRRDTQPQGWVTASTAGTLSNILPALGLNLIWRSAVDVPESAEGFYYIRMRAYDNRDYSDWIEFGPYLIPDADGDQMPDTWEIRNGLNPNLNDALENLDRDGFANIDEYRYNTNPQNADTDNDGLDDYAEVFSYNTNPNKQDTDDDGLIDGVETGATLFDGFENGNFGSMLWLPSQTQVVYNNTGSGGSVVVYNNASNTSGSHITLIGSLWESDNIGFYPQSGLIYSFDNDGMSLYNLFSNQPPAENSLSWDNDANYIWQITNTDASEFTHSACSADNLPDNQKSSLKLLIALPKNILMENQIKVYFDYKLSSEYGYDFFRFAVNSSTLLEESGEIQWTNVSSTLKPGINIIEFKYEKDKSFSSGLDKAWIDNFKIEISGYGTSPTNPDSDGDGMLDGWEVANLLNPNSNADRNKDTDKDGLTNYQEYTNGTNPQNADTDDDGLGDKGELFTYQTNPFILDIDNDGITDGAELKIYDTNLRDNDTDDDGLTDGEELDIYIKDGFKTQTLNKYKWVTDGDFPWEISKSEYYYDAFSACSPDTLMDNQSSSLKLTVHVKKSAEYSFYYQVSSEKDYDFFKLIIDSQEIQKWSGNIGWTLYYGTLSAGTHTIEFKYIKDDMYSHGYDKACIDGFSLVNYGIGTNPLSADSDNDTMPDGWEARNSLNPLSNDAILDFDNDTITNVQEYYYNTNPNSNDTDNDGITDQDEINNYHTNPSKADTDSDLLSDYDEITNTNTSPLNKDMDGDGILDGTEVSGGTNPFMADKWVTLGLSSQSYSIYGNGFDISNFSISINYDIFYVLCNLPYNLPFVNNIYKITAWFSNIIQINSDSDRMPDWWEIIYGTNKSINDSETDYDCDTLANGLEYYIRTNPNNNDTDSDLIPDNYEYMLKTNPLIADNIDYDNDGLDLLSEIINETDPYNPDTDGDSQSDAFEVKAGTDPLDPSSIFHAYITQVSNGLFKIKWTSAPNRFYTLMIKDKHTGGFRTYYENMPSTGLPEDQCIDSGLDLNGDGNYNGESEIPPPTDLNVNFRLYKIVIE